MMIERMERMIRNGGAALGMAALTALVALPANLTSARAADFASLDEARAAAAASNKPLLLDFYTTT